LEGRRVLVADDDPLVLEFCRIVLEAVGYSVRTVDSGAEAVRVYRERGADVVLVDLVMPGMGGLEALKVIRQGDPDAAVVLITAHAEKDSILHALRLGAKELIEKPLDGEALVSVVDRVSRHAPGRTLRGDLRSMTLATLLQACCGDRREGRLRVRGSRGQAVLFLAGGSVIHAELDDARGEEAFYRLLRWTEGEFELDPEVPAPERSISREVEELLLEGLCRIDEASAGPVGEAPSSSASLDWEAIVGDALDALAERTNGLHACALVAKTGTVVAARSAGDSFDSAGLGSVVAVMVGSARSAMARFGEGEFEECVIAGDSRLLVLRPVGEMALAVLGEPAHAGPIRLVARQMTVRLSASLARFQALGS
jgi:two-component system chemotaxis response regulator CheY